MLCHSFTVALFHSAGLVLPPLELAPQKSIKVQDVSQPSASALATGGKVHQVPPVIVAPSARESPTTSAQGAPVTVVEQPPAVMVAAQMELSVVLVVSLMVEHMGQGRSDETVPATRMVAVAQPVVTPPL